MRRVTVVLIKGLLGLIAALTLVACAMHLSNSERVAVPPRPDGALRVATFNSHYINLGQQTGAWSLGNWNQRKGAFDATFKALGADVVAFQELESFQRGDDGSVNLARDYLLEQNPAYRAAASGDWRDFPSTQPVFYRTDRLDVLDQGWFFFSDTPDVIYSRTFNGSYPAFCSWVRFQHREGGRPFTVYNVHFEYKSGSNRRLSAALVAERMRARIDAAEPVFLVGDLNARVGGEAYEILSRAGVDFVPVEGATYHFDRGFNLFGAIDHIGATPDIRPVGQPVVLRRQFDGEWPSDHYPVVSDFVLPLK
ncbi:endonuclease/exonuclease/phosphatase family protein [Puniceibacterium sediminis]|uniref:Metal-dependent hydrolase, endonuclease/exonuclease/phosphatase family n=1 Tax=Puniceibacterium sediminis TaxID=1608407 RepID=A0A238XRJ6_9RHOB|nr:endonuclease/exonuclease/phosphatase family protein [Puniceibacterium sediminis]SNR61121.1 Metal-dependent hydrolase, endonuclease/exonuclease/phosphatase family [Puniceibacterium sediminis]